MFWASWQIKLLEARDDFPLTQQRKQYNINDMALSEENWVLCPADDDGDDDDEDDDDDDDDDDDYDDE